MSLGERDVRVALIGYGYAGQVIHVPLIRATTGLALTHVVSSRPDEVMADLPDVQVARTAEEVISNPAVDLIVIATPNSTHFELGRAALRAEKHVVIDKPMTVTSAEAEELFELATKTGRVLSVFHNRRWDADFQLVRRLVAERTLGEITHFESHFDRYRPQVLPRWREQKGLGTGLWYDLGPHLLDQAFLLFKRPDWISADMAMQRNGACSMDYFHVTLGYGRMRAILHASALVAKAGPRFVIHGSKGSFVKFGFDTQERGLKARMVPGGEGWGEDSNAGVLSTADETGQLQEVPVTPPPGNYGEFYRQLRAAVTKEGTVPVSGGDTRAVARLLEAGERSAKIGCVVVL